MPGAVGSAEVAVGGRRVEAGALAVHRGASAAVAAAGMPHASPRFVGGVSAQASWRRKLAASAGGFATTSDFFSSSTMYLVISWRKTRSCSLVWIAAWTSENGGHARLAAVEHLHQVEAAARLRPAR